MIGALAGIAMQIVITVTAPDTITVRQPATVTVRAQAIGLVAPTIKPPSFAPLRGMRSEESTQIERHDSLPRATMEHRYLVVASRPGAVILPAFEARIGKEIVRSSATRLIVRGVPSAEVPAIVSRARLDTTAGVNFHALVAPETVYVGQQATYQVGVFLNDDVRFRLRRNPEFVPPELRSMLAYDIASPRSLVSKRQIAGRRYEIHVFQRALFPLTAGRYVIPPARLNYSLPLTASFFSREESHAVRSESVTVVAVDPPAAGRPSNFRGAVGQLRIDSRLDSHVGRVGDPLLLTVRVSGAGNVNFFPRPEVRVPWGQAVNGEERVRLDSSATVVRGLKEFDWVITPAESGSLSLPEIRYPFFNPLTERYELAVSSAERLTVAPGSIVALDSTATAERARMLAVRSVYRAPIAAPITSRRGFWAIVLLAPLPAALLLLARRPRPRRVASPGHRLRDLARRGGAAEPWALRRAYADALARRVGVSAAAMSDRASLVRALRRGGVSLEVARAVDALLGELDTAVYARGAALPADASRRANELFKRVDAEAKPLPESRSAGSFAVPFVLLFSVAAAAPMSAQESAPELFARGVRAYEGGRHASAARLFAEAARLEPRSADAWANFGTAAWAAHDTAAAAVGWQRAIRLDPLASDVRDRLDLIPGFRSGILGDVPSVPVNAAALAAALCWVVAWAAAVVVVRRRSAPARAVAWAAGTLAVVLALVTIRAEAASAGRRLAVVVEGERLRSLPALGAEQGPATLTGEVAQAVGEQGVWTHVRLSDGREGWLESERLQRLGARR